MNQKCQVFLTAFLIAGCATAPHPKGAVPAVQREYSDPHSTSLITQIINQHQGEIRVCYDAAKHQNPAVYGKVTLVMSILPSGSVLPVTVKDETVGKSFVGSCISSRVQTWHFPKLAPRSVKEVLNFPFFLSRVDK